MTTTTNTRVLLVRRPRGTPRPDDFVIDRCTIPLEAPAGGALLQTLHVSIDPAMRGWMSSARSYLPPVKLGDVMRATAIGRVVASDSSKCPVGALVRCEGGVQSFASISAKEVKHVTVLPDSIHLPPSVFLGALGTTGLTAYFGLLRVGMPQAGETVLVSGAAGATGSCAAQIARIKGCRVVGTAGSDDKCRWLEESHICDVAINYKKEKSLSKAIRRACPRGASVVYDNVGGPFLEAALSNLARGARVVLCGAISQYNADNAPSGEPARGPRNYMNLLVRRASMRGFVVFDYRHEYDAATREMARWIAEGKMSYAEHVVDRIENFYPALMSLFNGTNKGKVVLNLAKPESIVSASLSSKL